MRIFTFILVMALAICLPTETFSQKNKNKKAAAPPLVEFDSSLYASAKWRSIGPYRGGRSCAVTGVPGKPNLFYFGGAGGGVWRTKDGGRSWENISDGYFGGSIGAVAVAPSDNNVIYVGGGEKTVRGNVSYGYGVWKSEDTGKTWKQMGLENSRHISRIRIHPDNPDIVFAAVMGDLFKDTDERGVYKSTDGGKTWKQVLFSNSTSGAVDLIIDPNNPRIMFASTWRIRRTPYSLSSGGDGSALWKSTDSGETWTNISNNNGLPKDTIGIIGIAISPVNSERVWAIIESKSGGVFRSEDGGLNWKKINESRSLRQRAWYYSRIYADPHDVDVVYVMNVRYHKSKDGGKTFKPSAAPHGDHHDLWIAPENPQRMIIGDDGGAQVTYDGGETWTTYHNQPTAQFYRVTTDDHFPFRIYVAQQDNSTLRISNRTDGGSIGEDDWERSAGCECGHIAIDPLDNDIVYGGCYGGLLQRKDHRTGFTRNINVWPDNPMGHGVEDMKYRFQWNFPIFFSPHNPKKLYTASNHLHVSYNEGQSWETISPDLTTDDKSKQGSSGGPITQDNTAVEYYCTIFAAAESPVKEGVIWTGSDDGLVHVTQDGGKNWENITPSNLPEWAMINSLEPSPYDAGTCYIAATKYKLGDYRPMLFRTSDYGKTWTKINNGIANDHFTRVVRCDPVKKGILYAGTESGMYVSFNDGGNWQSLQNNLPIVPITDLTVKNNTLIASTQGRSIWMIDDLSIVHEVSENKVAQKGHLFKPSDSFRMPGYQQKNPNGRGTNHPGGVTVHFMLPEKYADSTEVKLVFMEKGGEVIKEYSSKSKEKENKLKVKAGANTFNWNMRYEKAKDFKGMILWWASMNGPKALPGDYSVKLTIGENEQSHDFKILKDPRVEVSDADMKAQFDFLMNIRDKITESHNAIGDMKEVSGQLKSFTGRLEKDDENLKPIFEKYEEMDSLMTAVEEALYQTKNEARQDPLNFPIRLTNKLAHLTSLTGGDYPPTEQAEELRKELTQEVDAWLAKWYEIESVDINEFNELVRDKGVGVINLKRE